MVVGSDESARGEEESMDVFHGWMATDANSPLTYQAFKPKAWDDTDVDIRISHCGVCASDLHTRRSGWVSHHRSFSISPDLPPFLFLIVS